MLAPDHPKLLAVIAGACAATGANIVDAQISTTTDGLALDSIALRRAFDRDEDESRRAQRVCEAIEKALVGEVRLPEVIARKTPKGRRHLQCAAGCERQQCLVEPPHRGGSLRS